MTNSDKSYIPNNSVLNSNNTQVSGDFNKPYSLIEWIKNLKIVSTNLVAYINSYNQYLNDWFDQVSTDKIDKVLFVRLQYINLLKEISLKYTTPDEQRFLSNINLNDNQSLDIAIPFLLKKLEKSVNIMQKIETN